MNIETIAYSEYESKLPQEGNFILGQQKGNCLWVYQAFNDRIADFAIAHQKFGGPDYSFSRMTWIKPNFLWMMYRSGWAEKENQQRILAIEITMDGFSSLLEEGVLTSWDRSGDQELWREKLSSSDVRIQWDPDHDPNGNNLKRRAVQIGIKAGALQRFSNDYILSIEDITDFVKEQKRRLDRNEKDFLVVKENVIEVSNDLKDKFAIPR